MGAGGDAVRLVAGQGGGSTQGNHYPEVMQWRGVPGGFSLSPMGSHVGSVNLTHEGATGRFTPAFTGLSTYGGIPAACPWIPSGTFNGILGNPGLALDTIVCAPDHIGLVRPAVGDRVVVEQGYRKDVVPLPLKVT